MRIPRILLGGTHSGVGKTTIATGLMAALKRRGFAVQGYKVGPDYIDPGYHTLVTGRPSRNLDVFMLGEDVVREVFCRAAGDADIAVIEGVMGLYDGARGGMGSTAHVAKLLQAPVLLIVDVRASADSAAAVVLGFLAYDPAVHIAGVILNQAGSDRHLAMAREAIETRTGVPVVGHMKREEEISLPERHLGLVPVTENAVTPVIDRLVAIVNRGIDLSRVIELAKAAPRVTPPCSGIFTDSFGARRVRIGIARDAAFSFYYQDSLDVLTATGAELVPFSPLTDQALPGCIGAIIFGGGFPEMFAAELAGNTPMLEDIRRAHARGIPIYAECGGLMYLSRGITGFNGETYPLAGLVPGVCRMQRRLVTVGYVTAQATADTPVCAAGEILRGHEFHFSTLEETGRNFPWAFTFTRHRDGGSYPGGYLANNLLASYLHFHMAGAPQTARRLAASARIFMETQT